MDDHFVIETICPICDNAHTVTVPKDGYRKWRAGAMIQSALPSLSADDREMLVTGICSSCWETHFGEDG